MYSGSDNKENIYGKSTFSFEPKVNIPEFNLKSDNWSDVAAEENQFSLDFKTLAANVEANNKLYASKSDQLALEKQKNQDAGWAEFSKDYIGQIASVTTPTVISLISLSLSIYLFFTRRAALASFLPIAQRIPTGYAYLIHSNQTINFQKEMVERIAKDTEKANTTLEAETFIFYLSFALVYVLFLGKIRFFIINVVVQ